MTRKKEKKNWEEYYDMASEYYKENGNVHIAQGRKINGVFLGQWLYQQRVEYKKGLLTKKKIKKLEAIGIVWDVKAHKWEMNFKNAKKYFAKYGDLMIPTGAFYNGENLGSWLSIQRRAYSQGKLSEERIKKLESIGMIWDTDTERWKRKYDVVKEFYDKNGHLDMPKYVDGRMNKYYSWLKQQVDLCNAGKLTKDKADLLDKIGIK